MNIDYFSLAERQIFLLLKRSFHICAVGAPVDLRARAVDCRALAQIEHTHLQSVRVRRETHFAAERIYLAHEMSF